MRVTLTRHAHQRIASRLDGDDDWVVRHVREAMLEQRWTRKPPRWAFTTATAQRRDGCVWVRARRGEAHLAFLVHQMSEDHTTVITVVVSVHRQNAKATSGGRRIARHTARMSNRRTWGDT